MAVCISRNIKWKTKITKRQITRWQLRLQNLRMMFSIISSRMYQNFDRKNLKVKTLNLMMSLYYGLEIRIIQKIR
jgi:hypothetical protein